MCSQSLDSVVSDVTVLRHVTASDHRLLVFKLLCQLDAVYVDFSVNTTTTTTV